MSDVRDLYRDFILDHGKRPRNTALPDPADHQAQGHNPLCGDRLTLALTLRDDAIADIGCQANGCAISVAAASAMTEAIQGKTPAQVRTLYEHYDALVHQRGEPDRDALGDLTAFASVAAFPLRIQCATLAWQTLFEALGRA